MLISKVGKPFKVTKEMHLATIQTLIGIYSKTWSFVVDLFTSIDMCFSSNNSFLTSVSNIVSNHLSPCKQHFQGLPKPWAPHPSLGVGYGGIHGGAGTSHWNSHAWTWCQTCSYIASILTLLSKNTWGGCLTMSKLSTCINIMHSLNSFYCIPHIVLFLYLQNVVSIEELPFIWGGCNVLGSFHYFSVTFICQGSSSNFGVLSLTSFMNVMIPDVMIQELEVTLMMKH
jgi:hypothetical protein